MTFEEYWGHPETHQDGDEIIARMAWNAALEAAVESLDCMSAYDQGSERYFVERLKSVP